MGLVGEKRKRQIGLTKKKDGVVVVDLGRHPIESRHELCLVIVIHNRLQDVFYFVFVQAFL